MEDHLRDRHRLEAEWQALCTDEVNEERASSSVAISEANANKNRYIDCIPCKCVSDVKFSDVRQSFLMHQLTFIYSLVIRYFSFFVNTVLSRSHMLNITYI